MAEQQKNVLDLSVDKSNEVVSILCGFHSHHRDITEDKVEVSSETELVIIK